MMPKQREMDSIVKEIYKALSQQDHLHSTVLILCGDHGMNDAGNHGGSSVGETSPALVFISPKFQLTGNHNECPVEAHSEYQYYRTVEQSDITPTLASLLGVPIPLNNLGVFIPELLSMWDSGKRTQFFATLRMYHKEFEAKYGPQDGRDYKSSWRIRSNYLKSSSEHIQNIRSLLRRRQKTVSSPTLMFNTWSAFGLASLDVCTRLINLHFPNLRLNLLCCSSHKQLRTL
jgi:arylsulfatase A-like enzyme